MLILLKAMLQKSVSKKIVIANTMALRVDSVRCLFKVFVLINVLAMDTAVVVFVRYTLSP